jgi:hypothetical protein
VDAIPESERFVNSFSWGPANSYFAFTSLLGILPMYSELLVDDPKMVKFWVNNQFSHC